jgi:curved DNA-binding protein CbpA
MTEKTKGSLQPGRDSYAVLGVDRAATADEIKQAYFTQVRLHPPEREPEVFKRIREAYDRLRTPEKRIEADMGLLGDWPAPVRTTRLPEWDLYLHVADVLTILKADTDLTQTDFFRDFREVHL